MKSNFSVSLARIVEEFSLKAITVNGDPAEIMISSADVNRPGLQFSGYYEYYDSDRIQIVGKSEVSFLETLSKEEYQERTSKFLATKPPLVVIARGIEPSEFFINQAKINDVPLYQTTESTSDFMSALIAFLNVQLAPRITRHGVLVDVYGEGILILGESGVGKSEAAIELVKRGHRMIADDAVEIRKVSHKTLVGSAPENIRHFIELRGVGVVNARRLFGIGSVKVSDKIDMVIQLEPWDAEKNYDRLGLDAETMDILGISVPISVVPVTTGRNISIIIEAAAMNNRQKKMGYNAARQLLHNLGMTDEITPEEDELEIWHNF
jgi:HPr kinase/phosphorylase